MACTRTDLPIFLFRIVESFRFFFNQAIKLLLSTSDARDALGLERPAQWLSPCVTARFDVVTVSGTCTFGTQHRYFLFCEVFHVPWLSISDPPDTVVTLKLILPVTASLPHSPGHTLPSCSTVQRCIACAIATVKFCTLELMTKKSLANLKLLELDKLSELWPAEHYSNNDLMHVFVDIVRPNYSQFDLGLNSPQ